MMSKLSSNLFALVALQAAWLQPGSLAAASLLPGFAGDASNGSFVGHRLNVTSLSLEHAGWGAKDEGGVGGFGGNDDEDFGGLGGRRSAFHSSHDSQLFNEAMAHAMALIDFSVLDPARVWNESTTLFLATNDEDRWFASVHAILQQAYKYWNRLTSVCCRSMLKPRTARPRSSLGRFPSNFRMCPRICIEHIEPHAKTRTSSSHVSENAIRFAFGRHMSHTQRHISWTSWKQSLVSINRQ
jgi:hypothetical protein